MRFLAIGLMFTAAMYAIELGEKVPNITLSGDEGGFVKNDKPFRLQDLEGKIFVIMFADPDERSDGEALNKALKEAKKSFPENSMQSIALINLKATWKPNWIISKIIRSKQEKYPTTWFVQDVKGVMMRKWGLKDDAYECIVVDEKGRVILYETAPFSSAKIADIVNRISDEVFRLSKEQQ